jgi:hypothetical protein
MGTVIFFKIRKYNPFFYAQMLIYCPQSAIFCLNLFFEEKEKLRLLWVKRPLPLTLEYYPFVKFTKRNI